MSAGAAAETLGGFTGPILAPERATVNGARTPTAPPAIEIRGLPPAPEEAWRLMRRYAGPSAAQLEAMRATVEPLFRRGPDLVAGTYDYLLHTPETAAVLGWEAGADPAHLAEATALLHPLAGARAGARLQRRLCPLPLPHGPDPRRTRAARHHGTRPLRHRRRRSGGSGLRAHNRGERARRGRAASAIAGWNQYLLMQLDQMLAGAAVAHDLASGPFSVPVRLFGRLRGMAGRDRLTVAAEADGTVHGVLRRFLAYLPAIRADALDRGWEDATAPGALWQEVAPAYTLRRGWRVLCNGRDIAFAGGVATPLRAGDTIDLFPPGR
ncbi:MAG: MoaD/ThiS family protein [Dehalococcoidia bacterium]